MDFSVFLMAKGLGGLGFFLLLCAVSHKTLNTLWSYMKQILKSVS